MTTASRARHRLAVVAAVALVAGATTGVARAAGWTVTVGGGSTAQAQSLQPFPPTTVSATCTSSSTKTIIVSWSSVAHATYTVLQSVNSGSYSPAVTGVTGTTWTTASLGNGKYTYEVAALVGSASWQSANSAPTVTRTIKNASPNCS